MLITDIPKWLLTDCITSKAGFDIGSTSTRACVECPSRELCIEVENKDISRASSHKHDPGDYTSIGYPFDDDNEEVYLGEKTDPDRLAISLKYAFYVLSDVSDDVMSQYALIKPLRKRMNEEGFRKRLRRGLADLFSKIWKQIEKLCKLERLKITTISLSIPAQWTRLWQEQILGRHCRGAFQQGIHSYPCPPICVV